MREVRLVRLLRTNLKEVTYLRGLWVRTECCFVICELCFFFLATYELRYFL
jgi:hypothetical protein